MGNAASIEPAAGSPNASMNAGENGSAAAAAPPSLPPSGTSTPGEVPHSAAKEEVHSYGDKDVLSSPPSPRNGDENESMEILFQFIPYYGQGDPSNDSLVRSTLMGLSIEDIDYRDQYGNTLILLACQHRCEDLVRIMLNKGADPNATNASGACCLHFACYSDSASKPIAKLLLQNGANPDVAESTYGCTPLHYCSGSGDLEFCKLLISFGAQVQTLDYYNYTCADYARDAGFTEAQDYLSAKIKAWEVQQQLRNKNGIGTESPGSSSGNLLTPSKSQPQLVSNVRIPIEWQVQYDANTSSRYYSNIKTNEVLWEQELVNRLTLENSGTKKTPLAKSGSNPNLGTISENPAADNRVLIEKASRARLIAFLTTHDPTRLMEIDSILTEYKNNEKQMLADLCAKYNVKEDSEMTAFASKLEELTETESKGGSPLAISTNFQLGKSTPVNSRGANNASSSGLGSNPGLGSSSKLGSVSAAEASAMQKELQQRISIIESQFEEERTKFRSTISDKEGQVAKLESTLEAAEKERNSLLAEKTALQESTSKMKLSEGEQIKQAEQKYNDLSSKHEELQELLEKTKNELSIEKEKLSSLESSMSNLQSSETERVEQEKAAADERARQQREKDEKHAMELRESDNKRRQVESKLKSEIAEMKAKADEIEAGLTNMHETYKRAKEKEIADMNRDIAERKAKYAQELSAAQQMAEAAVKRADAAEAMQKLMQDDIEEARQIQGYNAQLHKDLAREQVARKRLHNEMEDMKGKIRVYVRIRPLSNSEMERNCTEAALKDGKLSVLIKSKDGKKNYDFDQVFAGKDGNTQADIFRDTKHLMMSVIDGYNVCIFAYGQTGAGKSFTMIGAADIGNCLKADGEFDELAGITPRAVSELFRLLKEREAQITSEVEVQMFQLYRDGIEDLLKLSNKEAEAAGIKKKKVSGAKPGPPTLKITLAEHSPTGLVLVEGAETCLAFSPNDVMQIFAKGAARRTTSSTQMNAESSRSHLICCLTVKLTNRRNKAETVGKLTLVDLAGSERVDKSGAQGDQMKEAQSINKSLSALGDVISALTSGGKHVPYRNHPLTMLMSDSLGGNAKTLMFVNTSPADYNVSETISSLKFAIRCKDITNAVSSGPGAQASQMTALKKELAKLKKGEAGYMGGKSGMMPAPGPGPPGGLGRPTTAHHDNA